MAFSFPGTSPAAPVAGVTAQLGPDLENIQTEHLSFLSLAGEAKIQLLPTAWPSDQLPPSTASLMSIASQKGLVAAAGPSAVIVATTESVRKAFEGPDAGDNHVKPFQPQLNLPMSMRISQLAFTADELYLVLAAEIGGGLAVYDVQALLQGKTEMLFQLGTNGQALRALVPNPTPEKGELLALVTNDGNLLMANLKERSLHNGPNGPILKTGVSCVSWSTKGKQLVAGLGDGTAYQMTPEGVGKAEIPRPPNTSPDDHVSSITWLENNTFLTVYTPSTFDNGLAPSSTYYIIHRDPKLATSFMFQKFTEPIGPFGMNRSPPHQFMLRLREFPPNLQDVLVVASSASTDIGLFSRSKTPLAADKPAENISNVFTMTEMADDSRRAQLPMTADLSDTSPIGFAFDLSAKEKVHKPIPSYEEINESATPVPALMVLNNEGVLASWWFIYSDSIRQGTIYPGLAAAPPQTAQTSAAPTQAFTSTFGAQTKPAFGASAFGTSSSAPAFGTTALSSSTGGAFGSTSGLGPKQSPWGTPAATGASSTGGATFGSSAFGSSTAAAAPAFGAPAFGQTSTPSLGKPISPWATGSTAPTGTFGQSGGLNKPASPFGASTANSSSPTSSGFAAFANKGGFAAAAASPNPGNSLFGSKPAVNPFTASNTTPSVFGSDNKPAANSFLTPATTSAFGSGTQATSSPFGKPPTSGGIFGTPAPNTALSSGLGSGGFVLGSTFKADPNAKDDEETPSQTSKNSFFGGGFGSMLSETSKSPSVVTPVSKETDMDAEEVAKPKQPEKIESTTPSSTPAAPKTNNFFPSSSTASGGLFGLPSTSSGPAATKPVNAGFSFGNKPGGFSFATLGAKSDVPGPKTPTTTTPPAVNPFTKTPTPSSPKIKQEPVLETPVLNKIPEAPLPPDTTSKTTFGTGESSVSSFVDDPLPPDFTAKGAAKAAPLPSFLSSDAPLPPDFLAKGAAKPAPLPSFMSSAPEKKEVPAKITPPVEVPEGPEDDGDSSGFLTEDEEGEGSEEGSGEDVTKDLSPVSETRPTPGITPQSSFGAMKTRSPESSVFGQPTKPPPANQGRSLFGEVGASAPVLLPPKVQQSPRSPSPIRNTLPPRMSRPDTSRSVSAPGVASQILGSQRPGGRAMPPPERIFQLTEEDIRAEEKRRAASRARKDAEEMRALEDENDEEMQNLLSSKIDPTTTLGAFQVHEGSVDPSSADGVPAQVETVYRDINAMIDSLGLNARILTSFIQGHTDQYKDSGRTREDLENSDDWVLVEMRNLSIILEKELTKDLEDGRVKDVADKLDTCSDLQKDVIRLRAKHEDVKKIIDAQRDPGQLASARAQPLSAEQSAQQVDLRRDFTKFQKLLSEAEEGLTVLKAKIVSQSSSNGRVGGAQPTVEAVMRTITKMINMAEKRSGDIDVLENQMRKLRFSSTTSFGASSREGSPFMTPQKGHRPSASISARSFGTSSIFFTPETTTPQQKFSASVMSNPSMSSPRAKKLSGYTPEDKTLLRARLAKKNEVKEKLKKALSKTGPKVRKMDD